MIDAALKWADRGFAVFPLKPHGKEPLGFLVPHGLKEASRDHAVIRDWWRREPNANIGLRTGEGHFVVDLDDAEAVSWFATACGRHGGAPRTLTVKTAKGFHVYFGAAAEVPNSAGRIAPGVDVRGIGGYVVAAPSVHPSGHVYAIARDLPIAAAPQWLADLAMPDESPAQAPPMPRPISRSEVARLRGVASIISLVANAMEGERHSLLHWGACRFVEKVSEGVLSPGDAWSILYESGLSAGLKHNEVRATLRSRLGGPV